MWVGWNDKMGLLDSSHHEMQYSQKQNKFLTNSMYKCIIDACLKQVHKIPTQVFNFSHILCYEQIDILFWINQKKPM